MKHILGLGVALVMINAAAAQEPPKPGKEHEGLKKVVGDWDLTMKMMGGEGKGTATFKSELGGLWVSQTLSMDMGGMKFEGKGYDTYDPEKKKYIGVWFDSMSTLPMNLEGDFDEKTKTSTMTGEARHDGKMIKHTMKCTWTDDNSFTFAMYVADQKEPAFTIEYKRKKK